MTFDHGSSKVLDRGLSRIFDVKTRGDARTLQYPRASAVAVSPLWSGLVPFGGNRLLWQLVPS